MDLVRSLERIAVSAARAAWPVVAQLNRVFERPSVQQVGPGAALKSREPFPARRPRRPTRSAAVRQETRGRSSPAGGPPRPRRRQPAGSGPDRRARRAGPMKRCEAQTSPTSSRSTPPSSYVEPVLRARPLPALATTAPRGPLRPAPSSPSASQPLQHDVRPLLHGRQVGCPTTWGDVEDPRRLDDHRRAPDERAVLRRRAHPLAPLPPGDLLRPRDRLLRGPVRHERDPLRPGAGLRDEGEGGRPPDGLPPVRRGLERVERAPEDRKPLRREAPRHRGAAPRRDRRDPRRHRGERAQQRPGRADPRVRDRERRQDHRGLLPAGLVHRPRRGHRRETRGSSATRSATRPRRESQPARPSPCATGSH